MDVDPELGWPCPWVKVTQLLGTDHCYLVSGHDGPHLFKGYIPALLAVGGSGTTHVGFRPPDRRG
jgi:hypothetical protein